jgi:1-acyl-sn-glycerol-3-phosphate acyltransferase
LNLVRFGVRALLLVVWVLFGLFLIGVFFPWVGLSGRLAIKRQWSRVLLGLCGLRVAVSGHPQATGPVLWVVNHVSWLDIFVLNVVRSTAFVAKQEIRHWPLIGWLAAGADTIFIERGFRHAVHRVGLAMQARFDRGQAVGLFPEGTTSEGFDVLSFYANLFEPARREDVVIQPVALRYFHQGERSALAAFVGDESLVTNLWRVLGARGLSVQLVFLKPIGEVDQEKPPRAELAKQTREAIRQTVLS